MTGERILIIDSDPEHVDFLLTKVTSPLGYLAQVATNGQAGLNAALTERPDLVLLDLNLNGIRHTDLLRRLKGAEDPPVVLLMPPDTQAEALEAIRAGVRDVLFHPLQMDETARVIARVLHQERVASERDRLLRTLAGSNKALEQSLAEAQALFHLGKNILSSLNTEVVLKATVEAAASIAQADEGYLLLYSPDSDRLVLRAMHTRVEEPAICHSPQVDESIARQVLHTGEPVALTSNGSGSRNITRIPPAGKNGEAVRAVANVPLFCTQRQIIGVLGVTSRISEANFGHSVLTQLSALADLAAIAIKNAQVHTDAGQRFDHVLARVSAVQHKTDALEQILTEGVYTVDEDLRITSVNLAMEKITGWKDNELLGRRFDRVFVPQIKGQILPPELTAPGIALRTKSTVTPTQSTILCKDERRIPVVGTAVLLGPGGASPLCVLATMRDATLENELNQLLQKKNLSVRSQSFELDQLTEATLHTLHLQEGTGRNNCYPVTLAPIITHVVKDFQANVTNIPFQVNLAPDLPFANGNASKIELALINLIGNVLELENPVGSIKISASADNRSVVVRVTGGDATRPSTEHIQRPDLAYCPDTTGDLHLVRWAAPQIRFYIASKLIQAQGGELWTDCQTESGSCFHFRLPKIEVPDAAKTLID